MRLNFSEAAEADLEGIGDFIAEDNPGRAASFSRELWVACEGLLGYPRRFPLLRVGGDHAFRQRIYLAYRIIYEVRADAVFIVRILHSARDIDRILLSED